ncbi:GGDEF domain-containing protein [Bradyrhizobium canariense]|uniref:Diguanylate cyclase (GGDEF) domain-containing protein n=1 Tax=Bradyrhizobium canariense TaxID=255045 RepID=A0A1H1MQ55_9BRAD|nr:GGDEF domain-containing protein [Bradyrhizobium canariense]SDR88876.1 diguanylate cyclase (GGDEF) domain-containing protein [Bradyrhizobium canariense]
MPIEKKLYSLPRWGIARWLGDAGPGVPDDIRVALIDRLHGSLPVFGAGAINTIAVAAATAIRHPTAPFLAWLVLEVAICLARLVVLLIANSAALAGRRTPTDLHILFAVAWSASVGFGALISLASGDWGVATLASLSSSAMVGGICFRNFCAPRLAGTMILLSLGPIVPGVALAGDPVLYIAYLQVPLYFLAMTAAAFRLNKMLIATMRSDRKNDHLARHDALTGLLNRAGFVDALQAKLPAGGHREKSAALLFLDLDSFKPINDTFGHQVGDRLLKLVAERLSHTLSPTDVIARLGGDEFVVLANDLTPEQALAVGHRIISVVTMSYDLGEGIRTNVGVSVGLAMSPEHGTEAEVLLAVADAALYEAKSSGKSCCRVASAGANLAALRRLQDKSTTKIGTARVA